MTKPTFLPEWATEDVNLPSTGSTNKVRPRQVLRSTGWDAGQVPTAEEFNWMLNNIYEWINYSNDPTTTPYLQKTNNLNDVVSIPNARTNLDVYSKSEIDAAITAAKVAMQLKVGTIIGIDGTSTNPAVLYGYGTWSPYGAGRTLLGAGTTVDSAGESKTFTGGDVGGEFNHKLVVNELAAHGHRLLGQSSTANETDSLAGNMVAGEIQTDPVYTNNGKNGQPLVENTGSDVAHNNMQPYITVYYWKRTL